MENQPGSAEPTLPVDAGTAQKTPVTRTRVHSKYTLPSDRHPFPVHFEILRRFVTHTRSGAEPIPAERVEGEGIPVQAASMNVRFLSSIGLLKFDSKGLYLPTPEAIRFVNAKSVGDDRARPILRDVLKSAWFSELAVTVLQTQPLMTEDQFIGELALAAETDKTRKEPSLRVILELLVYSGILSRDERGLSLGEGSGPSSPSANGAGFSSLARAGPPSDTRSSVSPDRSTEQPGWHVVQTEDYYLKVRSDPAVIDELTDQIELMKRKIARLRAKTGGDSDSLPKSE
jgi:hypothetical protein